MSVDAPAALMPPPPNAEEWTMGDARAAPPEMRTAKLAALIEDDFLGGMPDSDCTIARTLITKVFVPNGANTVAKLATVHKHDLRTSLDATVLDATQWLVTLRESVFGQEGDFPSELRCSSSALSESSTARSSSCVVSNGGSGRSTPVTRTATDVIGGLHVWDTFDFPPPMREQLRDAVQGSPDMTKMNNLLFVFNLIVFESKHLDTAQKQRYAKIICDLNDALVECDVAAAIGGAFGNRRQGRWAGTLALHPADVNDYVIELSEEDAHLKGKFITDNSVPKLLNFQHEGIKERAMACLTATSTGACPTRRPRMLHVHCAAFHNGVVAH